MLTKKELAKLKTAANNSISLAFDMLDDAINIALSQLDALNPLVEVVVADKKSESSDLPSFAPPEVTTPPATSGERGIVILALGHPYYGELAANLAGSIRFNDKRIPIHLLYTPSGISHLKPDKLALFTSKAEAPAETYTVRGRTAYFKAKTHIYDLSPFDKTLYLDADMLLLSKQSASSFIDTLNGVPFTIQNRDFIALETVKDQYIAPEKPPFYLWADVSEIKKAYDLKAGRLYGLHSELIYFEKGEQTAALFETIKEIYLSPKIKPRLFAGDMADELAFAIAMLLHSVAPHAVPYSPVYWWKLDGRNGVPHRIQNLSDRFFAYSVGGNVQPAPMVNTYNLMSKAYMRSVGVSRVWALKNKKQFIKERQAL